ncbi:alkane 1-monooxygenase [Maritimibacter sp. 55A14]|uniref:alkane 1-monooxygenase n=1 Tax=Maritimibacter sp. 55A14 TaxID=2174844 RepID=UPI000D621DFD|nr:alkane 1-monooxygenase [Maritimibacter sp. 55A14]PWE33686.1 alkane 1-monooxygenase [Maritimibacter sp. 55A14]
MPRDIRWFALVTLAPVPLLIAGALLGASWTLAALLYITLATLVVDALAPRDGAVARDRAGAEMLSILLGAVHFLLLGIAVLTIAGPGPADFGDRLAAFFAFGLWFGQVSNSNAHELIHRSDRELRMLGRWVYISLLFGHHASAHPAIHHRFVATPLDPNTARLDESFYQFLPRAWRGSFRAGRIAESARLKIRGHRPWHWSNPYYTYIGGGLLFIALSWLIAGPAGVAVYLLLCVYSVSQLLLSDYVQHYGLVRNKGPDGKYEPVSPAHSWNAPHWMSGLLMLNAPRHSDHHANPSKSYPDLRDLPRDTAPELPFSLPVMAGAALIPPLWQRLMHPRLEVLYETGRIPGPTLDRRVVLS